MSNKLIPMELHWKHIFSAHSQLTHTPLRSICWINFLCDRWYCVMLISVLGHTVSYAYHGLSIPHLHIYLFSQICYLIKHQNQVYLTRSDLCKIVLAGINCIPITEFLISEFYTSISIIAQDRYKACQLLNMAD